MSALDTVAAIASRRSIRVYEPKPIPSEDLKTILEAARLAPSAANRQPWHLVVVRDPQRKRLLASACSEQRFIAEADVVIAGVAFPAQSQRWYNIDVAIAMENLVLAAASLGYGTCWIGAFREAAVKELLGIPEDGRVIALTPLGIPAEHPAARERKPDAQLFSLDRYGQRLDL